MTLTRESATPSSEPILRVSGLNKIYESKHRRVEAVHDLTFDLEPGELVCIVGPSGSGKTTLLRCIAGLLEPSGGEIVLRQQRVVEPPRDMAVVFQDYGRSLFPWMTVWQNVELPLKEKRLPKENRTRLVSQALEAVDLPGVPNAHPWQLSGGMQQRVAIARAIAYEPHVLLMDEPFAAVDAQTRADLEDLVRALWERLNVTTLFVTHDIDEAVYLGERVLVLSSSPTVILEDVAINLPRQRDQLTTRSLAEFADLRARIYALIQQAKRGSDSPDPNEHVAAPSVSGRGSADFAPSASSKTRGRGEKS